MTDPSLHPSEACANCGEPFELNVSYPVVTRQRGDELEFYSFCDDDCRSSWEAADD